MAQPLHVHLDGDNILDSAQCNPVSGGIDIQLSQSGTVRLTPGFMTSGDQLIARDIDRDGDLDLILLGTAPTQSFTLWLNDGKGRFQHAPTRITLSEHSSSYHPTHAALCLIAALVSPVQGTLWQPQASSEVSKPVRLFARARDALPIALSLPHECLASCLLRRGPPV